MTDDARRVLTEEERARVRLARPYGLVCGSCGAPLAEGEPVWIQRLGVGPTSGGRGAIYWRAPVCESCAAPSFRAQTEGADPEPCAACGRGVYYQSTHPRRRFVLCSKRCGGRYQVARARKETRP